MQFLAPLIQQLGCTFLWIDFATKITKNFEECCEIS
jgi:hypothetical protein